MRISRLVGAFAAGLGLAAGAAGARGENLSEAWAIALRVNQGLQAQQFQSAAQGLNLAAAKSTRYPTVRTFTLDSILTSSPYISTAGIKGPAAAAGGSGAVGTLATGSGTAATAASVNSYAPLLGPNQTNVPVSLINAGVPLYTGGKITNTIAAAGAQVGAQRAEEGRTALDLKLTVATAYVGVLRAGKNLEVARTNVEQLASFARDVRNRREQGLAIRSDELAAEVSLANARITEIQSRTNLATAWATYNRYLCRPLDAIVPLDDLNSVTPGGDLRELADAALKATMQPLTGAESDALIERAVRIRPELAGLTEQARAQRATAEATRAGIRPQVTFNLTNIFFGSTHGVPQDFGAATFLVDWTITDSGQTRRRAAAQHQQEAAAVKRRNDTAADVALEVRTRWLDLFQARQRVPVSRLAIAQAEENIKVVTDRYRQQLSNYTEVLDAETRRVQSLTNFYNAVYDESLAGFRLHRSVGDL